MKIGIGDADVPGNETVRADIDPFLSHHQRAIEQCEIAHGAFSVFADRKRAARVAGNMFPEHDSPRFPADQFFENLRAFAVKAVTEFDIGRDRMWPPILLDVSILFDVGHVGNFPDVNSFA